MIGDIDDILERLVAHPEFEARIKAACERLEFNRLTDEELLDGLDFSDDVHWVASLMSIDVILQRPDSAFPISASRATGGTLKPLIGTIDFTTGYWKPSPMHKLDGTCEPAAMQAGVRVLEWSECTLCSDGTLVAKPIEVVATTTSVKTTRYTVKRKRDPEPKPWPGFELR